jgi:hypothetical protein
MNTVQWISYRVKKPTHADYPLQTKGGRGYASTHVRVWTTPVYTTVPFNEADWIGAFWASYTEPLPPKTQEQLDSEAFQQWLSSEPPFGVAALSQAWNAALAYARK